MIREEKQLTHRVALLRKRIREIRNEQHERYSPAGMNAIDIFLEIPECTGAYQVIQNLALDPSGKTYKRIEAIKERYGIDYKK